MEYLFKEVPSREEWLAATDVSKLIYFFNERQWYVYRKNDLGEDIITYRKEVGGHTVSGPISKKIHLNDFLVGYYALFTETRFQSYSIVALVLGSTIRVGTTTLVNNLKGWGETGYRERFMSFFTSLSPLPFAVVYYAARPTNRHASEWDVLEKWINEVSGVIHQTVIYRKNHD